MNIRGIGSAPVSFGVYGTEVQSGSLPLALLDHAAWAGYEGMELGPPGFFGTPDDTADAFVRRGLTAVGAYVPIHLSADEATVSRDLAEMSRTLAELAACGPPLGLAILADAGTPELLRHPARSPDDRQLALGEAGWRRLSASVGRALALAERAGVPTSFHPHVSTYIESPWEVERLLQSTDVSLTLDTGHFLLAGADPGEHLGRFGDRVNHVHLKDVRRSVLERAKAEARTDFDTWWGDVSTPIGAGDVDLAGFLEGLRRVDYDGWLVIEQDRLPLGAAPIEPVAAVQAQNLHWVQDALARSGAHVGRETEVSG